MVYPFVNDGGPDGFQFVPRILPRVRDWILYKFLPVSDEPRPHLLSRLFCATSVQWYWDLRHHNSVTRPHTPPSSQEGRTLEGLGFGEVGVLEESIR